MAGALLTPMGPTKTRLHRSELAVPGSNVRMLEKAPDLGADVVMLDLEDAVAPDDKEQARLNIIDALTQPRFFAFAFQQLQDGQAVMVLEDPRRVPPPEPIDSGQSDATGDTGTIEPGTTTDPAAGIEPDGTAGSEGTTNAGNTSETGASG